MGRVAVGLAGGSLWSMFALSAPQSSKRSLAHASSWPYTALNPAVAYSPSLNPCSCSVSARSFMSHFDEGVERREKVTSKREEEEGEIDTVQTPKIGVITPVDVHR